LAEIRFTGNLGADPEVKTDRNGGQFIVFSVSDEKSRPDGNGGWETLKQQWLSCAMFSRAAEYYQQALHKGARVTIWGEFYARPYEGKNGPGTSLDVVVDAIKVWPPKNQGEKAAARQSGYQQAQQEPTYSQAQQTQGWGQNPNQQQASAWGQQTTQQNDAPPF